MTSSSTSSIHKSIFKYDVFLSFRGEDTRTNFVDHLYDALKRQNIETYKDDKNLQKGNKISKELIKAIEESRFHIIVFSKNYASSSWCLDELVKIMECQKMQTGQTIYPIFYDVEPTEVRKQCGEFGKAFAKHEKHEKDETVEKWREALVETTSLSGRELRTTGDGHEAEFIKLVVKEISLRLPSISADDSLVGMRTRINVVVSSLNTFSDEFCMIGITGMGGIGKTTLARAVFDHMCNEFEGSSFVENVRKCSNSLLLGLKSLQQQVLRDVLSDKDIIVNGVFDGKKMMKKQMPSRKVLIVLDDVDHIDQLKALAGEPNWFMKGSRIIITTREKQVLVAHKVNLIHDVNLLTDEEAICLLSRCAFGTESPSPGYERLSSQVVRYAAGLPLTITVLGSSLCDANEDVWIDTLERLKKIPLDETLQKLELSYMGLDADCKEIFLDVACILKGWKEDEAIRVLESRGFHAIRGLNVLENKSLVTISRYGCLDMHDHIQEMGKYIVRRSNLDEPRRHTRLWIEEEIIEILAKDLGTEATTCIYLFVSSRINRETVMKGFGNMKKLRFLLVHGFPFNSDWELDEDNQYFPNSLQYLKWQSYPFRSLPIPFQADNLVSLEMFDSGIVQLWEGGERKVLDKLRYLDFSYSKLRTLDLGLTPNLEMLDLQGCNDLIVLDIPVGCHGCPKLKSLKLSGSKLSTLDLRLIPNIETLKLEECKDLVELDMPRECPQLKSLNLSCQRLRSFNLDDLLLPKLEYLRLIYSKSRTLKLTLNLKTLILENCDLVELHSPDGDVKLESLDIKRCLELKTLDLGQTPNLKSLSLQKCSNLVKVHSTVGGLKKFTRLIFQGTLRFKRFSIVDGNGLSPELDLTAESVDICPLHPDDNFQKFQFNCWYIEDLPSSIGNIEKLLEVGLTCACRDLQSFFGSICGLQQLKLLSLEGSIPEAPKDLGQLEFLEELRLLSTEIKHLPDSICMLKHLKILRLDDCKLFEKLPEDLGRLECLEELTLTYTEIKYLPDSFCMLKHLKSLVLIDCKLLQKLPEDLGRLECLEELTLTSTEIKHLPDSICMLKHLKTLELEDCELLEKLPEDLGRLECLETLILTESIVLQYIPNSICKMKCLKYFGLRNCNTIEELPEELGCIECLKELNIEGTCINHLPLSILSLKKGLRIVGSRELLESCGLTSKIQTVEDEDEVETFCYIQL